MKKGRNTAENLSSDCEPDDIELPDDESEERILILKTAPPSMKVQLLAHGVREIRCTCCNRVRLLAGAEQSEEGWVCEECIPEIMKQLQYGGQRGQVKKTSRSTVIQYRE